MVVVNLSMYSVVAASLVAVTFELAHIDSINTWHHWAISTAANTLGQEHFNLLYAP